MTVIDTIAPTVTAPADLSAEATSSAGAPVTYSGQTATDLVTSPLSTTCAPASGSTFELGTTLVTCSATDGAGNTGSDTFNVTVGDTTDPVVSVPSNITAEATGPSGAVVAYSGQSAVDSVDGPLTPGCTPLSGSTFAITTTLVTCTATDAHDNTGTGSFNVLVRDTTGPALSDIPATQTLEATGPAGASLAAFAPTSSDLVDGDRAVSCTTGDDLVGADYVYPLDATTVVACTATDTRGNVSSANYSVTVEDTTGPQLTVPADITEEATGPSGAAVTFAVTASDLVDGAVAPDCSAQSGDTFPVGTTSVTCSATDAHGNESDTLSFDIIVQDTTPPSIEAHGNETAEATSPGGALVSYTAPATADTVDEAGVAVCAPATGTQFALGATTVTCNAADVAGNDAEPTTFTVTVVDTTPPVIDSHEAITAEATSSDGAIVNYDSPATSDIVDLEGAASCLPGSGGTFSLGDTTVTCSARDAAGNNATSTTFVVSVVDTTAPTVDPHANVVQEATSAAGAVVNFDAPASHDAVDGDGSSDCVPPSGTTYPLGTTTVTCSKTDAHNNGPTESTFTVTVQDTTAPAIAAHGTVAATATSSSGATVGYDAPAWTDAVSGTGTATCTPASGSVFPVGSTTVTCTATDAAGNTATSTFLVSVSFGWHGFFQPIDTVGGNGNDSTVRAGTVFNKAKAGSAIPVKFDLSGNMGLNIFAAGYPKTMQVACPTGIVADLVEEIATATTSGLKYDAATNAPYGQYNYTWKTATTMANSCQRLEVKLTDGTSHYAFFQFTK